MKYNQLSMAWSQINNVSMMNFCFQFASESSENVAMLWLGNILDSPHNQ